MTFNKGPWLESNQGCRSRVARAVTVRLPGCSNNLLQQDKTPSACQPGLTICFANCSLLTIDLNMFSFSPPPSFTSSPVLFAAPPSPPSRSLQTSLSHTARLLILQLVAQLHTGAHGVISGRTSSAACSSSSSSTSRRQPEGVNCEKSKSLGLTHSS